MSAAGRENIPVGAMFELTHRCNLRCAHCYLHCYDGGGELATPEWLRAIDELAALGGLWLSFTGGEIFLRSDVFDLIARARQKGFALKLLTNGLLLDDASIARLADLWPSDVHISVYAACPEIHDGVTGMQGSWEQTVGAIRGLCGRGLHVTVKTPVMSCNFRQIEQLQRLADDLGAVLRLDTDIVPGNDGSVSPLVHRLNDEELVEVFRTPHLAYRALPEASDASGLDSDLCGAARRTFSISPVGEVQPCISNPVSAGNIREDSLADIWWRSPLMLRYRGLRVADLAGECVNCEHRAYCGRCSAMAALEDGDYLGPSRWACRVSVARRRAAAEPAERVAGDALSPERRNA